MTHGQVNKYCLYYIEMKQNDKLKNKSDKYIYQPVLSNVLTAETDSFLK